MGMLLEVGYTAVLMLAALLIAFIATGGRP